MDIAPLILARRISNLTDARYFAAKAVDWLIFNLTPGTEGYLDPIHMQAMREWVEGPGIAGEFGAGTPAETVQEAAQFFNLGAVLITTATNPGAITAAPVFVAIEATHPDSAAWMEQHKNEVSGWILSAPEHSGSWLPLTAPLAEIASKYPVYLEYTGPAAELQEMLSVVRPKGLSITGGEEEAVGVKSFDEVEALFEVLGK